MTLQLNILYANFEKKSSKTSTHHSFDLLALLYYGIKYVKREEKHSLWRGLIPNLIRCTFKIEFAFQHPVENLSVSCKVAFRAVFFFFRLFVSILLPMPKVWNYFELCSSTIALFSLDTSVSNWVICDCDDHVTRNCVESFSILMCNYWTAMDIFKYVRELTIPPGTRELTRNEIHCDWLMIIAFHPNDKQLFHVSQYFIFSFTFRAVNENCAKLWKTLALETKISKPKLRYVFFCFVSYS